jgi:hypothetical protein
MIPSTKGNHMIIPVTSQVFISNFGIKNILFVFVEISQGFKTF